MALLGPQDVRWAEPRGRTAGPVRHRVGDDDHRWHYEQHWPDWRDGHIRNAEAAREQRPAPSAGRHAEWQADDQGKPSQDAYLPGADRADLPPDHAEGFPDGEVASSPPPGQDDELPEDGNTDGGEQASEDHGRGVDGGVVGDADGTLAGNDAGGLLDGLAETGHGALEAGYMRGQMGAGCEVQQHKFEPGLRAGWRGRREDGGGGLRALAEIGRGEA